jgi:glycosyltransferase involved in cell wall biosynthesis
LRPSLTVLLPVRDCQSTLWDAVLQILDVLPDLTDRFEVVIIDDGSMDATIEVADELAARYPQVVALRQARPLGQIAAVRTGLERSSGEIVLLRDAECGDDIEEIPRLWWALTGPKMGQARVDEPSWSPQRTLPDFVARGGFRMFVRSAVETSSGLTTTEVSFADPGNKAGRPKRPNYLARLRDFALGE